METEEKILNKILEDFERSDHGGGLRSACAGPASAGTIPPRVRLPQGGTKKQKTFKTVMIMKTTLKLIIALVLAGAGIGQTWADPEPPRYIGHITYTKGTDDHGTLSFYNRKDGGIGLSPGEALDVNNYLFHPTDDEGKDLEGYCVYIYAYPDEGYTVKDMTLEAEVTTTVMQSRRRTAADSDASFDIGQKLTLTPVEGTPYIFEMVIPEDPNLSVTVTAKFAPKGKNTEAVSYIDADGVTQTKEAGTVYVMDGTEEKLAGWYVCNSTISYIGYEGALKAVGDVHLILADGAAMSVEVPNGSAIDLNQNALTIYGQSTGADMGSLTVNGQHDGIGTGGNVTINGGGVDVNGNNTGIAARNVNINGGNVTAYGYDGYGINSDGDITLGWNSASGSVKAASYHISGTGSVKIADGKVLEYTDDSQTVTLRGTLDADALRLRWLLRQGERERRQERDVGNSPRERRAGQHADHQRHGRHGGLREHKRRQLRPVD